MKELVQHLEGGEPRDYDPPLSRKGYLRVVMQVIACGGRLSDAERKKLLSTELLYGVGDPGVYGICLYEKWIRDGVQDVIQVSAFCGEAPLEMWITVAHELAHVLAGRGAGHGSEWNSAARKLGLINPKAGGPGCIEDLDADLVTVLKAISLPTDGQPICDEQGSGHGKVPTGCKLGIGTRGGKTHGPGTGRLRLWLCECKRPGPVRVRVASDNFRARCLTCGTLFKRAGVTPEADNGLVKTFGGDAEYGAPFAVNNEP